MSYDQLHPQIDDIVPAEASVPLPAAETETPSISRQYREVLYGGVATYLDLQAKCQTEQAQQAAQLTELGDKMAPIYATHRHLKPENLALVKAHEDEFQGFIDTAQAPEPGPEDRLRHIVAENPAKNRYAWTGQIAVAVAAASVRQYSGASTHRRYRDLLYQSEIQHRASQYLLANLGFFQIQSLEDLSGTALAARGLSTEDLDNYTKLSEALSDQDAPKLRLFTTPPLHLTQLATDVRNDNAGSVLPYGLHTRLPGRKQPGGIKELAGTVISAHDAYLMRRYNYDWTPDRNTLAVLAECDLAERGGFLSAPREEQTRTVNRVYDYNRTFAKAKPQLLHPEARVIFDEITRLHHGTGFRNS